MSNSLVPTVYTYVIDEVCDQISATFAEMGVGQNVLAEMRQVWKQKISAMRIADFDFGDEVEEPYPDFEEAKDEYGADYYPSDGVESSFPAGDGTGTPRMPQEDGPGDEPMPGESSLPDGKSNVSRQRVLSRKEIDAMVQKLWTKTQQDNADDSSEPATLTPVPIAHRSSSSRRGPRIVQHDGVGDDDDEDEEEDDNEDGINSELDDDDSDDENYNAQHLILCQYEKVNRVKNKWKCTLKDGIITVNGRDYVFNKANGEFEW
ncbi:transcription factor IIA subunit alpha [Thoreauomyces humboldtii]|nr:transcription factor IIA subunit alpha [Thoreauomyces humboldtii]